MALVKFPLKMADDFKCYTLDQLKEHFDIGSVVNYFHTRQLIRWLRANRYAEELAAVEKLSANENNLAQKLGAIFGFEIPSDTPDDGGDIARLLKYLKQFTDDKKLLAQIEQEVSEGTAFVARNQTELNEEDAQYFDKIYLVSTRFLIPLDRDNKTYVGIGDKVTAIMESEIPIDTNALNIKFESISVEDHTIPPEPEPEPVPSPEPVPPYTTPEYVEILTAFKEIEKDISNGCVPTKKMANLQKRLEEAKDVTMLRELAVLYDNGKSLVFAKDEATLMEHAKDCRRIADQIKETNKHNAEKLYDEGCIAYQERNYTLALEKLKKSYELGCNLAAYRVALIYKRTGNHHEANRWYNRQQR